MVDHHETAPAPAAQPSPCSPTTDIALPAYLNQLWLDIPRLSTEVAEATDSDILATFAAPETLYSPDIPAEELWEYGVNGVMHAFLGKSVEEMQGLVRRGAKGVEAFYRFVKFFIQKGVNPLLFEARSEALIEAMQVL